MSKRANGKDICDYCKQYIEDCTCDADNTTPAHFKAQDETYTKLCSVCGAQVHIYATWCKYHNGTTS